MKYEVTITGAGIDAFTFLEDEDCNFIIIFNENAPEELAEISVLHTEGTLNESLSVNDTVSINGKKYTISAIGSEAEYTLKTLGHCTLGFNGGNEAERPGYIMLEGEPITEEDFVAGTKIEIF
ncbi:MAG: PTS glucitol/sorbitol transporter subunit IIA [Tyzzerella sp.]|uniref:PTS glucitol/sorbitol transporter subunit IIA n=1 Tax=Candidatus Fimicola merdigallinarum TaxID=2840819 RepID=A0A9D9DT97_9FIRM|nr:PTS glucitol/sorbitol transporter subunit IIA [Candidatus Fimicola merdigallinarum]